MTKNHSLDCLLILNTKKTCFAVYPSLFDEKILYVLSFIDETEYKFFIPADCLDKIKHYKKPAFALKKAIAFKLDGFNEMNQKRLAIYFDLLWRKKETKQSSFQYISQDENPFPPSTSPLLGRADFLHHGLSMRLPCLSKMPYFLRCRIRCSRSLLASLMNSERMPKGSF